MAGGGLVDDAADVGGARVEDVVEALLEQIGGHGDVALDHRNGFGVDVARDQLGQGVAGLTGDLGRLRDHRVAGGDGRGHRPGEQLDRIVPGCDDQSDAERFGHDIALAGHRGQRQTDLAWLGPLGDVLADAGDLRRRRPDVGGEPFDGRLAEVGREGGFEPRALELEHAGQAVELFLAPLDRLRATGVVGLANPRDDAGDIDVGEVDVGVGSV